MGCEAQRPTATATPDPSVYDFADPANDCQDNNDQPLPCTGNDILAVRFQTERPSIQAPPRAKPLYFFPLTWVVIALDSAPGNPTPTFHVCVSFDLDADSTTGNQDPAIRGAEQTHCLAPGMEEIFITIYGSDGEYLQNAFFSTDRVAWRTDGGYVMGIALPIPVDPTQTAKIVPVVVSVCTDSLRNCDFIMDIEFANAEYTEPTPIN